MNSHTLLDANYAVLRMVLAEVGALERQLIDWLADMEALDPHIFYRLHEAWIERFQARIMVYHGTTDPCLGRNRAYQYVPILACMMPDLIGLDRLPEPPEWLARHAKGAVSLALGFPTSSPPYRGQLADMVPERNSMLSYFNFFSSGGYSLPNERWFDAAVEDGKIMLREMPHLLWLCREVIARTDPATPIDAADPRLDLFITPDTPKPSQKTIKIFAERLARPAGEEELAFARGFVREDALIQDVEQTFAVVEHVALYRAAVLPLFASLVASAVREGCSIRMAAELIIRFPDRFSSRWTRCKKPGLMRFGTDHDVTRFGVRNVYAWSLPNVRRGCLWMIAAAADPADIGWLMPMAEAAMAHADLGRYNRLVRTIGLIGTPTAIQGLARSRRQVRHAVMLGQTNSALADAAAATGLSTAEAEEFSALDHGLDGQHRRRESLANECAAMLLLTGSGTPRLAYEAADGAPLARLPAAVRQDEQSKRALAQLKAASKVLAADMLVHRLRLERSWLTGQTWSADAFTERWLGHPVLGWLARRQIWTVVDPDETRRTCLFLEDQRVLDADGQPSSAPKPDAILSLWHPLRDEGNDLVARWRRTLARLQVLQPIRQAWRETYVLTQAEHESSPDSLRFAMRALHQAQAVELARQRGWQARTLTPHMPSSESTPWMLTIPGFGVCAELRTGGIGPEGLLGKSGAFTHVVTDRVRFRVVEDHGDWRRDGARKLKVLERPVRLGDVDPVVFSEVMRDIDLLVSVAATQLDVSPEDVRPVPDLGQWRRQGGLGEIPLPAQPHFGGLARSRREVLETLLPEFAPSGSVELRDQHAIVHGRRHVYQIHLGSGDVLVLPYRRQLVLSLRLPPEPAEPPRLYLPLHDDNQLLAIINNISMLLRDDRIRDKSVLAQIEALIAP